MNFQVSFRISLSSPVKKSAEISLGTWLHLWMDVGVFPPYPCYVAQPVNVQCLPVHLGLRFPQQLGDFMNEDLGFFFWNEFLDIFKIFFIACMSVTSVCLLARVCIWSSEVNLLESVFFFFYHCVGSWD